MTVTNDFEIIKDAALRAWEVYSESGIVGWTEDGERLNFVVITDKVFRALAARAGYVQTPRDLPEGVK